MRLFITRLTSELARGNLNVSSCLCLGVDIGRLPGGNCEVGNLCRLADGNIERDACFCE